MRIPAPVSGRSEGTIRYYELTLQQGSREFRPGITTPTLGINGDYLGPTLMMNRSEQVEIAVQNQLSEATSLHWHGFHIPASEDGGPRQQIEPGASWNPGFKVMQNGGTYWYHSHVITQRG